jgi:integrase
MKKTWIYQRPGIKGWWVGWYEGGKRRAKALPNKSLATHYSQILYQKLNDDVFVGRIRVEWAQLLEEYKYHKESKGLTQSAITEAMNTLKHFERLVGKKTSTQLTQSVIDKFIRERLRDKARRFKRSDPKEKKPTAKPTDKTVSRYTVNKDISNLRAFIIWGKKQRYFDDRLEIKKIKVEDAEVRILNNTQIKNLMISADKVPEYRLRVFLAITTGLRRGDIEALIVDDIDFESGVIYSLSRKTGKKAQRPIPQQLQAELVHHIGVLPPGTTDLFPNGYSHRTWKAIRQEAGLPWLKFHDLRKTFASVLAQRGVSTAVTQRLLEHSTAELTNRVYTNVDPVLKDAVGLLPVDEWV